MKAAWTHTEEYLENWEEENILRLNSIKKQISSASYFLFKKTNLAANVLLFIAYKSVKLVIHLAYLSTSLALYILTTEASVNMTKEETWMFRSIK